MKKLSLKNCKENDNAKKREKDVYNLKTLSLYSYPNQKYIITV